MVDIHPCTSCQKLRPVNPAGLCPRCQHQADDATARVKPCIKCGSVEGRPDPRNGRIKRTRGMCSSCYDAWWDDNRANGKQPADPLAATSNPLSPDPSKAWSETESRGTDWASFCGQDFTRTLKQL